VGGLAAIAAIRPTVLFPADLLFNFGLVAGACAFGCARLWFGGR
jgi:hypothetical protein